MNTTSVFYQQMHLLFNIQNIKISIKTLLYSHTYMFQSVRTIIGESILSLANVAFFLDTVSKNTSL